VRLLAVSDELAEGLLANDVRRYRPDLIVSCGDVPFEDLARLAGSTDAPLLFVPGNHDPDLSGYQQTRRGLVLRAGIPVDPPWPPGTINVDGRVIEVAGVRVAGLGGSRRYSRGPNQYTERQQQRRARRLVARAHLTRRLPVDVVLTHAPIAGVGDGDDPAHRGFDAFRYLVAALRPHLLLHGHLAPVGGVIERPIGATRVVNVFDHQLLDFDSPAVMTREG
jgi:hypothetical protein